MSERDLDIVIGKYRLRFRSPVWWVASVISAVVTLGGFYITIVGLLSLGVLLENFI